MYFLKPFVLSIVLEVSFEVIAIPLLLFSEIVREDGVGVVPSLVGSIEHSFFSPGVVDGIHVFPSSHKGYLVWNLVNFLNCLSSFLMTTSALIRFS